MAFSVSDIVAIGGRFGLTIGEYWYGSGWETVMGLLIGPEVKITFPNNSAVIAGFGFGAVNGNGAMYPLRVGYKTKRSFFVTSELLISGGDIGFGIGLGFSFGGKRRQ